VERVFSVCGDLPMGKRKADKVIRAAKLQSPPPGEALGPPGKFDLKIFLRRCPTPDHSDRPAAVGEEKN
jgi:hypothetical protein